VQEKIQRSGGGGEDGGGGGGHVYTELSEGPGKGRERGEEEWMKGVSTPLTKDITGERVYLEGMEGS